MDLKGLQWLGNVYNKFEAMCVEMEEAMYQDTVKYVENQVQTVNQNVKRFCAEVVKDFDQDLYIDPVRVAAADLSLNPYAHDMKKTDGAKKELMETYDKSVDDSRVVISGKCKSGAYKRLTARKKGHSSTDPSTTIYEPCPMWSGNPSNAPSSIPAVSWSKGSDEVVPSKVPVSTCRVIRISREAKEKVLNPTLDAEVVIPKETDLGPTSAIDCSSSASAGEEDTWLTNKVVSLSSQNDVVDANTNSGKSMEDVLISQEEKIKDCSEDTEIDFDLTDPPDMEFIEQYEDDSSLSVAERLNDDCNANVANSSYVIDHDMELIEQYGDDDDDDSSLAETCVLVEKDNLLFLAQRDGIRKSYKKKLKEAFSGKKRSTKKEYEQLMLKYKDHNFIKESKCVSVSASYADEKPKISIPDTCSEPEWELL